ncbi:MAG TPA: DAK2 domain-containing protein [Acidimicrobiales bacterium]|nr:DAK2 domain-containing protein [Acidimicrobiales bacterium]
MKPLERLGPGHLKAAVTAYRDALRAHQERVNRLNVFPVPDGDTGTNMALTVESVVAAMDGAEDMAGVCRAISQGSLMGARGNSGVILSQILRGIAQRCQLAGTVGGVDMAEALWAASEAAYKAVMNPVEGTILTVVKGAAQGAASAPGESTLLDVLEAARAAATEALAGTPELLAVLKQAGVVDAGGAGFLLLLDAFLHVVDGRPLPEAPASYPATQTEAMVFAAQPPHATHEDLGPRYEVMHLLEARDDAVERLKEEWSVLGDSIAVVGGDGIWNCHVHTDDIGAAIEVAIGCGRPYSIRVADLHEQVEAENCTSEHQGAAPAPAGEPNMAEEPAVTTAVVAVAAGAGLAAMFASMGAHRIVSGGQSMNPSTAQLLEAVEAAPAADVVILPNNPNIVAVAARVDELSTKSVRVVPTRSIAEGLAAMMEFNAGTPAEANETAMAKAAAKVVSGELAQAVRASTCAAGPIAEGDWLGLSAEGIEVVAANLAAAAVALMDRLVTAEGGDADGHEVVTIIEGAGSSPADTEAITDWLAEHRPAVEAEVHTGGQPLYPYLFSIE